MNTGLRFACCLFGVSLTAIGCSGDDTAPNNSNDQGGSNNAGSGGDSATPTFDPLSCDPPPAYPDPSLKGRFEVGETTYSAGSVTLSNVPVQLRAEAWYPANTRGKDVAVAGAERFPVILILHGNHPRYRDASGATISCRKSFVSGEHLTLEEIQATYPGATEIQNYLGYRYLGESLASAGYILISIDGNDVNCVDDNDGEGFVPERAELVQKHIEILKDATSSADPGLTLLSEYLDVNQLLYAGHYASWRCRHCTAHLRARGDA